MHLSLVTLFLTLYVSIVAATAGQMGFSLGVVVRPLPKRISDIESRWLCRKIVECQILTVENHERLPC
jgi:hypothetical protein